MPKIKALFQSRRFWLSLTAVIAIVFNEAFGIPESQVMEIATIVIAWVIGDSIRAT